MDHADLLSTAQYLLGRHKGKPKQADLKRATSTIYYALFHTLARCCADCMIGGFNSDRSKPAWRQVYRSLDHGFAKQQCKDLTTIRKFPKDIEDFSNSFVTMQYKRHQADYDPDCRITKSEVLNDYSQVTTVIEKFRKTPIKDRRAFAAFVLLKKR